MDIVLAHEVEQLAGDFFQDFFCEKVWVVLEVIERHKLNNVSCHVLPEGLRVECLVVAIQNLHRAEICITHSNYDDCDWECRTSHNLIDCLVHVSDDAICDYQADVELLIHLVDLSRRHLIVNFIKNFIEVGRPIQIALLQGLLIMPDYLCDSINAWIEDISVEGEAVRCSLWVGRYGPAKAVQVDHFVTVVELKDVADASDGVQVLVAVRVEVVQRMRVARVPIRHRKVDGECEIDLTPTEDVLQERVLPLDNKVLEL